MKAATAFSSSRQSAACGSTSATRGDTLWMTQAQIAQLFGVKVPNISRHIANILTEGELLAEATVSKIETVRSEGARRVERHIEHYSLDMVISVGYRVSSRASHACFRRWATGILVQFARKGFVVDTPRLKEAGNTDRIAELREIIRDIRSDEANVYAELRRICSLCQDYDGVVGTRRERSTSARRRSWSTPSSPRRLRRSLRPARTIVPRTWACRPGRMTTSARPMPSSPRTT